MTIITDMDDVLVNLLAAWVRKLNERYGTNVKHKDVKQWDMHIAFPTLTDKQLFGILNEEEFWDEVSPFYDAVAYLKMLIDEGHKVVVATASHYRTIRPKLEKALFPYFTYLGWKDIIMISDKHLLKGDVMIDDNPDNLKDFEGIKILQNAPYNQNASIKEYDFRVSNFEEAYQIIQELILATEERKSKNE